MLRSITDQDLATILAALRTYQLTLKSIGVDTVSNTKKYLALNQPELAGHFNDVDPLTGTEIDVLCEHLNSNYEGVLVVTEGGLVTDVLDLNDEPLKVSVPYEVLDWDNLKENFDEFMKDDDNRRRFQLIDPTEYAAMVKGTAWDDDYIAKLPTIYAERRARLFQLHILNEWPLPEMPEKYVALEIDHEDDIIWAFTADSKEDLARMLESSDTEPVSRREIQDLDTGEKWLPTFKIVGFLQNR